MIIGIPAISTAMRRTATSTTMSFIFSKRKTPAELLNKRMQYRSISGIKKELQGLYPQEKKLIVETPTATVPNMEIKKTPKQGQMDFPFMVAARDDNPQGQIFSISKELRVHHYHPKSLLESFQVGELKEAEGEVISCFVKHMNKAEGCRLYNFLSRIVHPNVMSIRDMGCNADNEDEVALAFNMVGKTLSNYLNSSDLKCKLFEDEGSSFTISNLCRDLLRGLAQGIERVTFEGAPAINLDPNFIYLTKDEIPLIKIGEFDFERTSRDNWKRLGDLLKCILNEGLLCLSKKPGDEDMDLCQKLEKEINSFDDFAWHPCMWTPQQKVNFIMDLNRELNWNPNTVGSIFAENKDLWPRWVYQVDNYLLHNIEKSKIMSLDSAKDLVKFLRDIYRDQNEIISRGGGVAKNCIGTNCKGVDKYFRLLRKTYMFDLIKLARDNGYSTYPSNI